MTHYSPDRSAVGRVGSWALGVGMACLLSAFGCNRSNEPVASRLDASEQVGDPPLAGEQRALIDRLRQVTDEVAASPQRCVHGVNVPASLVCDEQSPPCVREVVMNVNVFLCNDGCIDGPADTPVYDQDLFLLRPFAATLQKLDLQKTEITNAGLAAVAELTELRSLNLAGTRITGAGLERLSTLRKLEQLDLRETTLVAADLGSLVALQALRSIELPEKIATDDVLAILGRLPRLERLELMNAPCTDQGLAHLAKLRQLKLLDLSHTKTTDAGLVSLAALSNLTQLRLTGTHISGAGLAHLEHLSGLEELNLGDTNVDDAVLEHLARFELLTSLDLTGTKVRGHGLSHLKECRDLREASLPPLSVSGLSGVNAVKSWQRLSLTIVADGDLATTASEFVVTLNDMPHLTTLKVTCDTSVEEFRISNCRELANVLIQHGPQQESSLPLCATSLAFDTLPALHTVGLEGSFDGLTGDQALSNVTRMTLFGAITARTVRGICQCHDLCELRLHVSDYAGNALTDSEIPEFSKAVGVDICTTTADAAWLTRLVAKMPQLERLDLRVRGLNGENLAGISHCTQLKQIIVRGINDPGEPLDFLNALPQVDQCLVLGCPHIGRIRLTERAGVQRLYVKYGRVDSVEIYDAPSLTAVHLGHEAHGYNDDDALLNKLDIGRLKVCGATQLRYLMVDGMDSTIPFAEIAVANAPHLRSLLLRAPPSDRQAESSRLTVNGIFPELIQYRLFHLATDQASLDRLDASPLLRGEERLEVDVSELD